jgi:hypothetical protein
MERGAGPAVARTRRLGIFRTSRNRLRRGHHVPRETIDCVAVSGQAIMRPMKPRALYWWQTMMLAAVAVLLAAIATAVIRFLWSTWCFDR